MPVLNCFVALATPGDKLSMSAEFGTLCYIYEDMPRNASAGQPVSPARRRALLASDSDGCA